MTEDGVPEFCVREVEVPVHSVSRLEPLIGKDRYEELQWAGALAHQRLDGRTVWNFSSTAAGGGVSEMLHVLVGYIQDVDVDIRWLVMTGDPEFYSITKRIHNRLHGAAGDAGDLGPEEAAHYDYVTASNLDSALSRIREGDVVLLHDPQTAGMAPALAEAGARVVWRCHVGREETNQWTDEAWSFLRPHLPACEAFIFSVREYAPWWIDESTIWVIPPSIDPFSPKNQDMSSSDAVRALGRIGVLRGMAGDPPVEFTRCDDAPGWVERRAAIFPEDATPLDPGDRLVIQVSRWDHLKDMAGVLEGFASSVVGRVDAYLALVGPSVADVTDDPEGGEVFGECMEAWRALPEEARRRVRLVTLPMLDIDENAAMVNALQRHATIVVQKSLAEGFGLTVAEGMWKGRAMVASRVGGITSQVVPGTGILLDDPADLTTFGETLAELLLQPDEILQLGTSARQHVLENYIGDKHLLHYAQLIDWLVSHEAAPS